MPKYTRTQIQLRYGFLLLFFLSEKVMAEADFVDVADLTLEELMVQELIVTSAAKKPQRISDVASAIYVLSQDDIYRSGATSLPDLLRLVPGVQVARITAHKWAVSIRGFNSQYASKLLVLIDGRSIYSHLNAGVVWDIHNPLLEDIDRIEVIRGPGASIWGENAMNGVINIITKRPSETQGNLLVAGAGNAEKVIAGFRHGGALFDNGYYRVYGRYFDRDDGGSFQKAPTDDRADGFQVGTRMDINLSNSDLFILQGDYYQGNEKETLSITTFPGKAIDTRAYQYNIQGRWQHKTEANNLIALQFYYNRERWNNNINNSALVNYHIDTFDVDFQHRFQFFDHHDLTWGLGYRLIVDDYGQSNFIQYQPNHRNIQLFSAFFQDEITWATDFWHLIIGAKFEHNDYTGFEIQPSVRSIWNWGEHSFWVAFSRALRTPSRTERDSIFRFYDPGSSKNVKFTSTRDLKTEQMLSYEGGYRWQVNPQLNIDISGYYHDYKRLIGFDLVDADTSSVVLETAYRGKATIWGFEIAVDWRPMDILVIRSYYSYLDDHSVDKILSSRNQQTVPHHQILISAGLNITSQVQINLTGRYVDEIGDQRIAAYYGFDVHLIWQPVSNLELSFVGRNLLDSEHMEFNERTVETQPTEVKRSIYGKLSWRF